MSEILFPCPEWYQAVMQPASDSSPCGDNLEYDADFILLQNRLQTRIGAEYGNFVESVEPINWAEIERDARTLLMRSKDLRLIMLLMRCRLRQKGIIALNEGLEALLFMLTTWPEEVYPQLHDEGEYVPFMRANALAELEGTEGFLADFRQQLLPRVGGLQLSVRDVERGYASPREDDAPTELTLTSLQQGWQGDPAVTSLQLAGKNLQQLQQHIQTSLGDETPDFTRLKTLLSYFSRNMAATISPQEEAEHAPHHHEAPEEQPQNNEIQAIEPPVTVSAPASILQTPRGIEHRADALNRLREIRQWFMQAEPSSPVVALLAFTEQTIGKNFVELQQLLPAELMSKLNGERDISA